jgi:hypothetical protein
MTAAAPTEELLGLEREFWNAMKAKDAAAAQRMTDDQCIVVGAQGVSAIDRATMGKMTTEGTWELKHYDFDEKSAQVRLINDDVAVVAYQVDERLIVDGKPLTLKANDSSVWVRRDGNWVCALHTESLAGDPFGRDKKA